MGGNYNSIFQ